MTMLEQVQNARSLRLRAYMPVCELVWRCGMNHQTISKIERGALDNDVGRHALETLERYVRSVKDAIHAKHIESGELVEEFSNKQKYNTVRVPNIKPDSIG